MYLYSLKGSKGQNVLLSLRGHCFGPHTVGFTRIPHTQCSECLVVSILWNLFPIATQLYWNQAMNKKEGKALLSHNATGGWKLQRLNSVLSRMSVRMLHILPTSFHFSDISLVTLISPTETILSMLHSPNWTFWLGAEMIGLALALSLLHFALSV